MNFLRLFQSTNQSKPLGGRYEVISQLGAGGFGHTFVARDMHLPGQPQCVLKQLKPQVSDAESLQTARRLFDTEARVLYQLGNHDQIPRLLAHFEDNQEFYLAQELIEGHMLSEELSPNQPWSEPQAIALLQDILQVLAFVHAQNVIHRDIKPANLIRRRLDSRIILIDFGAVKQVSTQMSNPKGGRTNMTISIGTAGYMPKEQLGGTPRFSSDIYAVGMIAIQALTGIHPKQLIEDPRTGEIQWRNYAQQVSCELASVLEQMVRYDYRSRYLNATQALEALQNLPAKLLESLPFPQPSPQASATAAITQPQTSPTAAEETAKMTQPQTSPTAAEETAKMTQPPLPPTANQETVPISDFSPQKRAVGSLTPTSSAVPTFAVGNSQASRQAGGVAQIVFAAQQLIQKYSLKPQYFIVFFITLGGSFLGIKALVSPQPLTQTQTEASGATASSVNQEQQAAALLKQAELHRERDNYREAIPLYQQAIALKAGLAKAHWGLCYSLNSMGKPQEAIAACDQALNINPKYPEALWSKGSALDQLEKPRESLQLYNQALNINPKYPEALNNKGIALLNLNRPEEAFAALEKATTLKPNWADAWANQGAALWSLKRYDQAITSMEKALTIDPDHPNANDLRQQARQKIGR
ncbi:MAG: tetratricopeptide repeat protein [Symploca sp. SIO2E9]|nr:tetratricopeptide repeat protein [Symploca sp. SIO2E9]